MKKSNPFLLAITILTCSSILSQSIENLNGFNYLTIQPIQYQDGRTDVYGMMPEVRNSFVGKGFGYYPWQSKQVPTDLKLKPCLLLTCLFEQKGVVRSQSTNAKIRLSFYDCNRRLVYQTKFEGGPVIFSNFTNYFQKAVKKTLRPIDKFNFNFNPLKTPLLDLPEVEKLGETEKSLISYYDSNDLNDIEGIYKSYQSDGLGYYRIAIKRYGIKYKAIVLESDISHWKIGEVKAVFEPSSVKDFFSAKWFMANKTTYETFANLENKGLLSIEFQNPETKEKRQDKFIKMYPLISSEVSSSESDNSISATGSGFVLHEQGIIATNAHVVENESNIDITISTANGKNTYKSKVLLKDEINDVALLKIVDNEFSSFGDLPYKISENAEIGESVFTIGFPLNSVMGNNIKVNNGIISSNTGIADDIRHYQISVPLQPGNSGGPLFNENGDIIGITSARLDGNAIGTSVQNVNYAIKSAYVLNLIKMLPEFEKPIGNSSLNGKDLKEKIRLLKNYVCLITVH